MLAASALKIEFRFGKIISITNIVIGVIAFLPALFCFFLTIQSFMLNNSNSAGDFFATSCWWDKIFSCFISALLIAFYRSIFVNPFLFDFRKQIKNERLNYWIMVMVINALTLLLFIFMFGRDFTLSSFSFNNIFSFLFLAFINSPLVQLLIATIGFFYNLLQKPDNSISNEN